MSGVGRVDGGIEGGGLAEGGLAHHPQLMPATGAASAAGVSCRPAAAAGCVGWPCGPGCTGVAGGARRGRVGHRAGDGSRGIAGAAIGHE